MASEIDDKKYELITRTENFDFAYDIVENFQSIKERLVHELRFPVDTRSVIPVIPVHSGCDIFDTVVQS